MPMSLVLDRPRAVLGVERSVTGRAWRERLAGPAHGVAEALVARHGLPDVLARVLAGRGHILDGIEDVLDPTLRRLLPDPSTLTDMDAAAARLADAVQRRERVAIFGDYDVDGACASALLARVLRELGLDAAVRIPDRLTEGYGPNIPAIEAFAKARVDLIVLVDCGTTSFEPLARAAELGLATIVVDHHLADAALPAAHAIVNPNRQDDLSGLGHLCAAGVTFLVCVALVRALRRRGFFDGRAEPRLMELTDLVALATVADVVPLTGLNRAYVARGLEALRRRGSAGLTALQDVARLGGPCEPYHLGFMIGPRINAGGRIGDAALGARLLMTDDAEEAGVIAAELDRLNRERQVVEQAAVAEAVALAEAQIEMGEGPPVLVVGAPTWHPGVVGLVAARLKEKFDRPAFALAVDGERAVGSGRSILGVDLGRAVRGAVGAGLLEKGGGHAMAAGVTIATGRIEAFRSHLADALGDAVRAARAERHLSIDALLTARAVDPALVATVHRAGPFGSGCPEPIFALPAHRVAFADVVGSSHVRVTLDSGDGARLKGIAFRAAESDVGRALLGARGRAIHVAGCLALERWQGEERVELRIIDAAQPGR
jgi:single-stranded-DNA-specific exonuclease